MIFKDNTKGLTGDIIEAKEIILDALNPSYSLPEGYYDSGTIIKIVPEELKVSPSVNTEEYVPTEGKVISSVVVNKVTGNATANDVLIGKTFNSEDGIGITGKMSMYNNIAVELSPDTPSYVIKEGYYGDKCDISVNAKDLELTADTSDLTVYTSDKYYKNITVKPTPSEVCDVEYNASFTAQTLSPSTGKLISKVNVPAIPTEIYNVTFDVNDYTHQHNEGKLISAVNVPAVPGNADAEHVLIGKRFSSSNGIDLMGSMKNFNGSSVQASSETLSGGKLYLTIPTNGYYTTSCKIYSPNTTQVYFLGKGVSFNVSSIAGYQNLSVDNFIVERDMVASASGSCSFGNNCGLDKSYSSGTGMSAEVGTYSKSYNRSTGVLTITKGNVRAVTSGNSSYHYVSGSASAVLPDPKVFLVIGDIRKSL